MVSRNSRRIACSCNTNRSGSAIGLGVGFSEDNVLQVSAFTKNSLKKILNVQHCSIYFLHNHLDWTTYLTSYGCACRIAPLFSAARYTINPPFSKIKYYHHCYMNFGPNIFYTGSEYEWPHFLTSLFENIHIFAPIFNCSNSKGKISGSARIRTQNSCVTVDHSNHIAKELTQQRRC